MSDDEEMKKSERGNEVMAPSPVRYRMCVEVLREDINTGMSVLIIT